MTALLAALAQAHALQVQSLRATSILSTLMFASAAVLVQRFARAELSAKHNKLTLAMNKSASSNFRSAHFFMCA